MSEIEARHEFRSRRQRSDEPSKKYLADLKKLAARCNFGDSLQENIRDQFVCGLANYAFRWRLMYQEEVKTLEEAAEEIQTLENTVSYFGNYTSGPFVRALDYTGIDWAEVDAKMGKQKVPKNTKLKILYQNVNGVKGQQKLSLWRSNLAFQDCYIVAATETLLNNGVEDEDVAIRQWKVIRKDREGTRRGVLLASRVGDLKRERNFETDTEEDLWASFEWNGQPVFICVVYFSPKAHKDEYFRFFEKTKSVIDQVNGTVVILGDMNLRSVSPLVIKVFNSFTEMCGLVDVNNVRNVFNVKLDVVLVRKGVFSNVYESEGVVPPDANHPPLNIELEIYEIIEISD